MWRAGERPSARLRTLRRIDRHDPPGPGPAQRRRCPGTHLRRGRQLVDRLSSRQGGGRAAQSAEDREGDDCGTRIGRGWVHHHDQWRHDTLALARHLHNHRDLTAATNNLLVPPAMSPPVIRDLYVFGVQSDRSRKPPSARQPAAGGETRHPLRSCSDRGRCGQLTPATQPATWERRP